GMAEGQLEASASAGRRLERGRPSDAAWRPGVGRRHLGACHPPEGTARLGHALHHRHVVPHLIRGDSMPAPLSERYADLANLLGAYFPGDDALDAEVEEMVAGLDTHHLDQFENDAAELLADDEVSEDELDAFVADGPNWDFGGGRATLAELLARVR